MLLVISKDDRIALRNAGMMGHQFCLVRTVDGKRSVGGEADTHADAQRLFANYSLEENPKLYFRAKGSKSWAAVVVDAVSK